MTITVCGSCQDQVKMDTLLQGGVPNPANQDDTCKDSLKMRKTNFKTDLSKGSTEQYRVSHDYNCAWSKPVPGKVQEEVRTCQASDNTKIKSEEKEITPRIQPRLFRPVVEPDAG